MEGKEREKRDQTLATVWFPRFLLGCLQSWKAEVVVHTVPPPGMVATGFVLGEDETWPRFATVDGRCTPRLVASKLRTGVRSKEARSAKRAACVPLPLFLLLATNLAARMIERSSRSKDVQRSKLCSPILDTDPSFTRANRDRP